MTIAPTACEDHLEFDSSCSLCWDATRDAYKVKEHEREATEAYKKYHNDNAYVEHGCEFEDCYSTPYHVFTEWIDPTDPRASIKGYKAHKIYLCCEHFEELGTTCLA